MIKSLGSFYLPMIYINICMPNIIYIIWFVLLERNNFSFYRIKSTRLINKCGLTWFKYQNSEFKNKNLFQKIKFQKKYSSKIFGTVFLVRSCVLNFQSK